ncbi:hypothetical protein JCM5296_000005 [Sporobolomyces johnsonii]
MAAAASKPAAALPLKKAASSAKRAGVVASSSSRSKARSIPSSSKLKAGSTVVHARNDSDDDLPFFLPTPSPERMKESKENDGKKNQAHKHKMDKIHVDDNILDFILGSDSDEDKTVKGRAKAVTANKKKKKDAQKAQREEELDMQNLFFGLRWTHPLTAKAQAATATGSKVYHRNVTLRCLHDTLSAHSGMHPNALNFQSLEYCFVRDSGVETDGKTFTALVTKEDKEMFRNKVDKVAKQANSEFCVFRLTHPAMLGEPVDVSASSGSKGKVKAL